MKQMVTKSVEDLTPDEIANLTDAELMALTSDVDKNDDSADAQADPSPTTEDVKQEDEPVGVLAKDGKSIIPIEVLQKERDRARHAEEAVTTLSNQVKEAQAELERLKAEAAEQGNFAEDGIFSEEEILALEEELPELAEKIRKAQGIVAKAQAKIQDDEAKAVIDNVQNAIDSVPKLAYLQASNKDLFDYAIAIDDKLRSEPEFANLTLSQRFEKVVERLEKTIGNEIKLPNSQKITVKDKSGVTSLDDIPGGTPPINDEIMSLANKSPTELAAIMEKMSDAEVDRFLARATKQL